MLNLVFGEIPKEEAPPVVEPESKEEEQQPALTTEQIAVKKANAEAAKYRVELRKLQAQIDAENELKEKQAKEIEMSKLDEVERLKQEKEDALKEKAKAESLAKQANGIIEQVIKDNAILEEATKLGFRNPALAKNLLGNIEIALKDGEVADREALINALDGLLEAEPYLKKEGSNKPAIINKPSDIKPKNTSQPNVDEEVEALNKTIRETKINDGVTRARAFLKKYILIQENSPKAKEIS